jgi:hypothetical protein
MVSKETIWLVVDHRISWDDRPPTDTGVKAVTVEAGDGVVMLGYSGLGLTAGGTQPSTWMAKVLRGRNLSVEQCLAALAHEMQQHLAPHILNKWSHITPAPAIVEGQVRFYVIGVSDTGQVAYQRLRMKTPASAQRLFNASPRAVYTGTGGQWLDRARTRRTSLRRLYSLARAHDEGRTSPLVVADHMASLNSLVAEKKPATVSPNCYVLWRHRIETAWEQQNYQGTNRVELAAFPSVPNVVTHGYEHDPFDIPGIDFEDDDGSVNQSDHRLE